MQRRRFLLFAATAPLAGATASAPADKAPKPGRTIQEMRSDPEATDVAEHDSGAGGGCEGSNGRSPWSQQSAEKNPSRSARTQ